MGIVRRHPFLTLTVVVASLPLLFLAVVTAAQHTPACSEWRAEVEFRSRFRKGLSAFDDYRRGDMPVDEFHGGVRDHVAWDLRESRPLFCK